MALVVKDRVQETSTTTGTGTLTLAGAVTGYQTFSSAIGNTNTTYYAITNGSEWEVGLGTVDSGTLSRDTVLESSNSGSLVNFSVGSKNVFCTYPAERAVDTAISQTLTNKTISGASNTLEHIGNSSLTNSSITINGTATALGGSVSVGTITNVTGTAPISSSGGTTPAISISQASGSTNGYLSSTDWTTFNNKGSGTVTSIATNGGLTGGTITTSGTISISDGGVTPAKLSTGAPSWDSSGVFSFNSGYGSVAKAYGCRAWVNFNGTGTVAIRGSGNVTSITDNGTGDYTVNFTTAMPDANYSPVTTIKPTSGASSTNGKVANIRYDTNLATGSCRVWCNSTGGAEDMDVVSVAVFR